MPIPHRQTTNKLSLSSQPSSAALTAHPIPVKPLNPLTFQHPHTKQPPVPPPTHRTDSPPAGRLHGRARCVGVSRWSYLAPEAPDGKVLCGHQPQSKPHLSEPGTHQRTWRVMGRPARQKPQTLSPCCWAPRRFPAPRSSRSFMAILKPLPRSEYSRMALRRFSAVS